MAMSCGAKLGGSVGSSLDSRVSLECRLVFIKLEFGVSDLLFYNKQYYLPISALEYVLQKYTA